MLPTDGRGAKFIGRVGVELDVDAGLKAARLAALNALTVVRQHLGSLDKLKSYSALCGKWGAGQMVSAIP
jgi:hypothetical protein